MSLRFAILGVLAREPMSGYSLAKQLERPVGLFWHARHSQIYPELAALERDNLVHHRVVAQKGKGRPDKKVFSITLSGRRALEQWVLEPPGETPTRDELLLKTFASWVVEPANAATQFREREVALRKKVAVLEEIEAKLVAMPQTARVGSHEFAGYATLRAGLAISRARLEWCSWLAKELDRGGKRRR